MKKINIFGGTGFIGSKFCELYSEEVTVNNRDDYKPQLEEILYFISTIDNYNIHKDLHVDVAVKFSLEHAVPECEYDLNNTFGFHGKLHEAARIKIAEVAQYEY